MTNNYHLFKFLSPPRPLVLSYFLSPPPAPRDRNVFTPALQPISLQIQKPVAKSQMQVITYSYRQTNPDDCLLVSVETKHTTPLNQKRRETQDVWNEGGKQEDTGREVLEPWMEKEEGRKEWRKEWRKRRRERFEVEREFGREIKGRTEQRRKNKLNLQRSPWGIRWGWSSGGLKMAPQPGLYLSSNCACDWE